MVHGDFLTFARRLLDVSLMIALLDVCLIV